MSFNGNPFGNFIERQKEQEIAEQTNQSQQSLPNNSSNNKDRGFEEEKGKSRKFRGKEPNRFSKKEANNIISDGGFLNKKQRKTVGNLSKGFQDTVSGAADKIGQAARFASPPAAINRAIDASPFLPDADVEQTADFAEQSSKGFIEGAGSAANVPAAVKSADTATRIADDAGKLAGNPKKTIGTATAIGAATVDQAQESFQKNPSKFTGQLAGNIAGGIATGSALARGSRKGLSVADDIGRRVKGQKKLDPTEVAEEDIAENPVNNFPEFEDTKNPVESFKRQSREKTPDEITQKVGEPADDEVVGFQVNKNRFDEEFEVQNPKTRPTDPEGTLFTAPSASLAFSSAGRGRGFAPRLVPRLRDFTPNRDEVIASRLKIDRVPEDVGNERVTRDFSEPINTESRGVLQGEDRFFAGDESRFFADSDRDFTDDTRAEKGVAYVRNEQNITPEAEALVPEGTRFVETDKGPDVFTRVGDTNLEIRGFKAIRPDDEGNPDTNAIRQVVRNEKGDRTGADVDDGTDEIFGRSGTDDVIDDDRVFTPDEITDLRRSSRRRNSSRDPSSPQTPSVTSPSSTTSTTPTTSSTGFTDGLDRITERFDRDGTSSSFGRSSASSSVGRASSGSSSSFGGSSGLSSIFGGSSGGSSIAREPTGGSGLSRGGGSSGGGSSGGSGTPGDSGILGPGVPSGSNKQSSPDDDEDDDPFDLDFNMNFIEENDEFTNEFADPEDII